MTSQIDLFAVGLLTKSESKIVVRQSPGLTRFEAQEEARWFSAQRQKFLDEETDPERRQYLAAQVITYSHFASESQEPVDLKGSGPVERKGQIDAERHIARMQRPGYGDKLEIM